MFLIRHGQPGLESIGVVSGGQFYDASAFGEDYDGRFFETAGPARLKAFLKATTLRLLPAEDIRLGSPIARPSKIVCIGLNYRAHARETGAELPSEPIIFLKSTTALAGPNDDIILPRGSVKTDWEVELAVVIGKKASYVEEQDAMDYVAGYCVHNDLSEREFQLERGGQWDKGKGCDTFAPLGPWLATPDEIPDPHNLRLWLSVNGKKMQDSTTADLIFNIPFLIAYTSRFMTLLPGDVLSTGTPPGVGLGMKPNVYLQPGDVVDLGIDRLGQARQNVKAYA
jgi:2,4-didehydro-3-deoxy-L-rhamnonate hydrolase